MKIFTFLCSAHQVHSETSNRWILNIAEIVELGSKMTSSTGAVHLSMDTDVK